MNSKLDSKEKCGVSAYERQEVLRTLEAKDPSHMSFFPV